MARPLHAAYAGLSRARRRTLPAPAPLCWDFCNIIVSCIETPLPGKSFNISGQEKIFYIDLIEAVKAATKSQASVVRIPYSLFSLLLRAYALVDRNPPFTTSQLEALVIPEEFEISIGQDSSASAKFDAASEALHQTFQDPTYSNITLEF